MRNTLKFLRALVATNLRASIALRGAFWMRAGFMVLNNFIWIFMWFVFFDKFEEVRGWRIADMVAMYAVVAGAFGLAQIFGFGVNELSRKIVQGDLDSFLTQPKNALLHVAGSRSEASGWGDLMSAVVLFALSGYITPGSIPICVAMALCGATLFVATAAIFHSSAFWMGNTEALSRQVSQFLILFSVYPRTIFGGWLKVVLYTGLPAGFISYLPVELLREFSWGTLFAVVAATAVYAGLAFAVFAAGLRRYESGNRFGVRV